MKNKKLILPETVLTRIVNKAILTGDLIISEEGNILLKERDQTEVNHRNKPRQAKDHVYRMVIVEGCCTQLTLSSLHTYIIIG